MELFLGLGFRHYVEVPLESPRVHVGQIIVSTCIKLQSRGHMTEILQGQGLISWQLDDLNLKEVGYYPVYYWCLGELRAMDFLILDCCGIIHIQAWEGSLLRLTAGGKLWQGRAVWVV